MCFEEPILATNKIEVSFSKKSFSEITHVRLNGFIGHFRVPKTLSFKTRPSAQPFLWKWVLFAWEWKIISISKTEPLISFWYRGPGELGNGLFGLIFKIKLQFHFKNYTDNKSLVGGGGDSVVKGAVMFSGKLELLKATKSVQSGDDSSFIWLLKDYVQTEAK